MDIYEQLLADIKPKTSDEVCRLLPYIVTAGLLLPDRLPNLELEGTEELLVQQGEILPYMICVHGTLDTVDI